METNPIDAYRQATVPKRAEPARQNNKADDQQVIEKRLVQQLGEQYRHAELIEISRGSYLIQNKIRLPIFGRQMEMIERNEKSIKNRGYLIMRDKEYYSRGIGLVSKHKYKLDPNMTNYLAQQQAEAAERRNTKMDGSQPSTKDERSLESKARAAQDASVTDGS